MAIIGIHQPGYLPWIGYFHKMMSCDTFVFLDDVQYEKGGWQNRNKIRTSDGSIWLTVPVHANLNDSIGQIKIDNNNNWMKKHKKAIEMNYVKSEFFTKYWPCFKPIYESKFDLLLDLDIEIIKKFMDVLEINTRMVFSSELGITTQSSERILDICKILGADTYVSGALGTNYLNLDDFKKDGITVKFQHVIHPVFKQCFDPFMPNLSTLDLLFNEGKNSSRIIKEAKISWK